VEAQGRKWIDGGSFSSTNAGLGVGYHRVVVIAPAAEGFPGSRGTHDDVADLKARGVEINQARDAALLARRRSLATADAAVTPTAASRNAETWRQPPLGTAIAEVAATAWEWACA
jgi:hypothetical protein